MILSEKNKEPNLMTSLTDPQIDSKIIAIIGPTGIGKTKISLSIAEKFCCEIVSVDSMQVYRYMDIGTAKATLAERQHIPHHVIDIVNPDDEYNLARYVLDATKAIKEIILRKKIPLLVGGTGLYLKGLVEGVFALPLINPNIKTNLINELKEKGREFLYAELKQIDPGTASRIHPNDTHRLLRALEIYQATGIPWSEHLQIHANKLQPLEKVMKLGLTCDREELYSNINTRVEHMLACGLLQEVQMLQRMGYSKELPSMQSIGYRHIFNYLNGEWDWEYACEMLARDTRRYAKRQYTWFHKEKEVNWFYRTQEKEIFSLINEFIGEC